MVCPTGALTEKVQFGEIEYALNEPSKKLIAQYSSASSISLAEELGIKTGRDMNGIINSALRKIGFDKVFETSFGVDLNIMEITEDFLQRFESGERLPLITGCCPAWIKFAEQNLPELLTNIPTVRSPQQITGALIKSWYAKNENLNPADIYSVSIMPCTAKKFEGQRVEMTRKGVSDIDTVLTTRELARLIRLHGIEIDHLEPEPADEPMGTMSSTGKLSGVSGGMLEGILRTVYFKMTGRELGSGKLTKLRTSRFIRETQLKIDNNELRVVAVSGMANVIKVLRDIKTGKKQYHIIEVMACQGGCIFGGGQPIRSGENALKARIKAIYENDSREIINVAHKNPRILNVYKEFLENPMSEKSRELLHTSYTPREVLI